MSVSDQHHDHEPNILLYKDILISDERNAWLKASYEEANSIILDNDTCCPSNLPPGFIPLTTKWLFKKKIRKGKPPRYKARLCVRGFNQRPGYDYAETYGPTAKGVTLRIF